MGIHCSWGLGKLGGEEGLWILAASSEVELELEVHVRKPCVKWGYQQCEPHSSKMKITSQKESRTFPEVFGRRYSN